MFQLGLLTFENVAGLNKSVSIGFGITDTGEFSNTRLSFALLPSQLLGVTIEIALEERFISILAVKDFSTGLRKIGRTCGQPEQENLYPTQSFAW